MDNLAISVRRATSRDAAAIADLVNRAYEAERFFVDGDRTSAAEIAELIDGRVGAFVVLEHCGGLGAAVHVERHGATAYFGMLAVRRELQGMGIGKRMVRIAEAMAEAMGAREMTLRIVNLREELGRWYRSLGYREVGTSPYVARPVKQACHFVEMHKSLAAAVEASLGAA